MLVKNERGRLMEMSQEDYLRLTRNGMNLTISIDSMGDKRAVPFEKILYRDLYPEDFKKLDIGSGISKRAGYETLDNDPIVNPDILADIEEKIPVEDETYDEIRCHHILEHIETKNKVKVLGELWRILKKGGILDIEVPNFPSPQSIQDPTHVSFWCSESFKYFLKVESLHKNFKSRYSQYEVPRFERLSEELASGWIYRTKLKKI